MDPSEAIELISNAVATLDVPIYHQVPFSGGNAEAVARLGELASVVAQDPSAIILVTHQALARGTTSGHFKADLAGITQIRMPFVVGDVLYLGQVGARISAECGDDEVVARALVRAFRKATRNRLVARSVVSGASALGGGLGCSDTVFNLALGGLLKLRQEGVENVEYTPSLAEGLRRPRPAAT